MGIYEEIAWNKRKSYILVFFFFIIIILLGYALGLMWGSPYIGLAIAFFFSLIFTLISFYSGDKAILAMSNAKPVKKQDYPHLYHTVEGLAIAAGVPKPKVYVIDDPAPNAMATGRDPKHASITVTTGLLEKLNRQELEGVIAHEMSHVKNFDIRLMLMVVMLVGIIILLSHVMLRSFIFGGGRHRRSSGGGQLQIILIVVGLVLAILAPIAAQLIKLAVSRKREYLADADGALLTRYPPGLANALRKISADTNQLKSANQATASLYIANPFKRIKGRTSHIWSSHPDVNSRIQKLESM